MDVVRLRAAVSRIAGCGFSEDSIRRRLGLDDLADVQWRHLPMYRAERLANPDPLALAIDLFLLQGSVLESELDRLLARPERDALIETGLLSIDANGWAHSHASLFPVGRRLIFSDHAWPELPHSPSGATSPAPVMAIGRDSRNLARCTVRRRFRSALDLCTGSGIQAALASAHCERVLAVDLNPRAAQCARFNARIAGIANLEVAVGDLFEPAGGERFDLIIANPPFVPSPVHSLLFRDGGRSGEEVQKRIVAGLPGHLARNGIAQMVTELGERDGEPVTDRLREWLQGARMDIHILRLGEHTANDYAVGHASGDSYPEFLASIDEWASNLRAQGYVRVVSLLISFQWSDAECGPPWERIDECPPPRGNAGAEIDAIFAAERLTRRSDWPEFLKNGRLRRAAPLALLDARMAGSQVPGKTKASVLGRALRIEHPLDTVERQILDWLDRRDMPAQGLLAVLRRLDADETVVVAALRSLLRRQLAYCDVSDGRAAGLQGFCGATAAALSPARTRVFLPTGGGSPPSQTRNDGFAPSAEDAP